MGHVFNALWDYWFYVEILTNKVRPYSMSNSNTLGDLELAVHVQGRVSDLYKRDS